MNVICAGSSRSCSTGLCAWWEQAWGERVCWACADDLCALYPANGTHRSHNYHPIWSTPSQEDHNTCHCRRLATQCSALPEGHNYHWWEWKWRGHIVQPNNGSAPLLPIRLIFWKLWCSFYWVTFNYFLLQLSTTWCHRPAQKWNWKCP